MKYFLLTIFAFFLTGCKTIEIVKVPEHHHHHFPIPSEMLERCSVLPPPVTREQYLALSPDEREKTLGKHVIALNAEIRKCDDKIVKITEREAEVKARIEKLKADMEKK